MAAPPSLMAMLSGDDDGGNHMAPFVKPAEAGGAVRHDLEQLEDLYSKPSLKDFKRKRRRTHREQKRKTFKDKSGALTYELERVMGEANMAYALGNQAAAIEHATKVVTKVPAYAPGWALLGKVYEDSSDRNKAIQAYTLAVHANDKDVASWVKLAHLHQDSGNLPLAVEALSRAARIDPSNLPVVLDAAALYATAGDAKRAISMYKAALDHPRVPDPTSIMMNVATIANGSGDVATVMDMLAQVVHHCAGSAGVGASASQAAVLAAAASGSAATGGAASSSSSASAAAGSAVGAAAAISDSMPADTEPPALSPLEAEAEALRRSAAGVRAASGGDSSSGLSAAAAGSGVTVDNDDGNDDGADGEEDGSGNSDDDNDDDADADDAMGALMAAAAQAPAPAGDGSSSSAAAAGATASSSSSAALAPGPSTPVPRRAGGTPAGARRFDQLPLALNACNMLCELLVASKKYSSVLDVTATMMTLLAAAPPTVAAAATGVSPASGADATGAAGLLPLDLAVKRGIALLLATHANEEGASAPPAQLLQQALECFAPLWALAQAAAVATQAATAGHSPMASDDPTAIDVSAATSTTAEAEAMQATMAALQYIDLFCDVVSALAASGHPQAALAAAKQVLSVPGAQAAIHAAPSLASAFSEHVGRAHAAVGDWVAAADTLVPCALTVHISGLPASKQLLQSAMDAALQAGRHSDVLRLASVSPPGTAPTAVEALPVDHAFHAVAYYTAYRAAHALGDVPLANALALRAIGCNKPSLNVRQRAVRQWALIKQIGRDGFVAFMDSTTAGLVSTGEATLANRVMDLVLRGAALVEQLAAGAAAKLPTASAVRSSAETGVGDHGADGDSDSGDDADADVSDAAAVAGEETALGLSKLLQATVVRPRPLRRQTASVSGKKRPRTTISANASVGAARAAGAPEADSDEHGSAELAAAAASATTRAKTAHDAPGLEGMKLQLHRLAARLDERAATGEEALATVRKVAALYPYSLAMWNVVALLAAHGKGAPSAVHNFKRSALRYFSVHSDSLPLTMFIANDCLASRSYRLALAFYTEAYRLAPREPLVSLGIAVACLCHSSSRVSGNRHRDVMRAFTFLAHYRRLRLAQSSQQPPVVLPAVAAAGGAATSTPAGSSASGAATAAAAGVRAAPLPLPHHVLARETLYNTARACHQLSLTHLAVHLYEACLAVSAPSAATGVASASAADASSSARTVDCSDDVCESILNVQRESAFNLALLWKHAGNHAKALAVTAKYLRYRE